MAMLSMLLPSMGVFTVRSLGCPVVLFSISLRLQKLDVKAQYENLDSQIYTFHIGLCFEIDTFSCRRYSYFIVTL